MIQTRICSYHKHHCTHSGSDPITFLSLPEDLRDRIYCDAGLIAGATLSVTGRGLSHDLKTSDAASFCVVGPGLLPLYCPNLRNDDPGTILPLYFNLSLSNSFVNGDLARFFYSHNEVLICCEDFASLSILLEFPPVLTKALRRLTIHLDIRPCHNANRHEGICYHMGSFSRPYRLEYRLNLAAKSLCTPITVWRKFVNHLAKSADLSKLRLSILCDIGDVGAAQLILEPLQRIKLAPDAIRLGRGINDFALLDIARRAVLGANKNDRPFRILDLPTELRQSILSFTDLVTPLRRINCLDGARFECGKDWRDDSVCLFREFCGSYAAVYPTCNCWMPPTAMFLVCKDMLQDARAIFFTSNDFYIVPGTTRKGTYEPFAASTFLSKTIPQEALPYLRSLKLYFPPVLYDFSGLEEGIYNQWLRTIDYVAPHLKTLALHVEFRNEFLYAADPRYPNTLLPDDDFFRSWQKELFRMHELIVQPLSRIDCLSSFSIQAVSYINVEKANEQQLRDHEMRLHFLVMGSSHDSAAR